MKLRVTLLMSALLLAAATAGQQRSAPQTPRVTTLNADPLLEGSKPYRETVQKFLNNEEQKIVGGKVAMDGAYPWQVSLGVSWIADPYKAHFCGGSIYSDRWIVTAAHCAENLTSAKIVVTAGTNKLVANATRRNVQRVIVHKDYKSDTHDNDIALLELRDPLQLSDRIKTIPLITASEEPSVIVESTKFLVTGWGATVERGTKVRDLRYLDNLPFVPTATCNRPLAYDGKITANMICAGVRTGGMDSCQGDSGGPLAANPTSSARLAGIVSWGEGCARPDKVGVYTRVANYVGWTTACVTDSATCDR